MLENAKKDISMVLADRFKLSIDNFRVYFHYPPTFYRLHLHVMWLGL